MSVDLWTMGNVANVQCCQFSVPISNVVLPQHPPFTLYPLLITHLSSLFTFKFHLKLATGNIGIGNTTTLATLKRKLVLCSEHCAVRHELRKVFVDDTVSLLDRVVTRKDVFRVIVPDFA